jgi:ribonuclease HII
MVVSFDEVGRGALAGPVYVGAVALWVPTGRVPAGLADSKALSAHSRESLVPVLRSWVGAWALGSATPREIDRFGILGAQARAANRALRSIMSETSTNLGEAAALVDGNYDWLRRPFAGALAAQFADVVLVVKGDATCASLAAASVLAKVERDLVMTTLSSKWGVYGWEQNKGYGSLAHRRAIIEHGASPQHRASWNLGLG